MDNISFNKIEDEELNLELEGQFYYCSERCGGLPQGAIIVFF